jgi:valyl-tRNA synthetase
MARLESSALVDAPPRGAVQTMVGGITLALPVAAYIDLEKERARLRKEIAKLADNLGRINEKLSNDNFVQNAPADIIAEQKSRQAEMQTLIAKFTQALEQLEAA